MLGGRLRLLGSVLLVVGSASAAPMDTRFRAITATDVVARLEFSASVPLRHADVCNWGSFTVWVDFDGTGVASSGKATSHAILAGVCVPFDATVAGHEIRVVGVVAPDGNTLVHFHLGE
jgi:hypothetical protein